ncbi:hypothetical protein RRG08_006984 [Elysia crispata]|uniref:Uncharacterized protein n=1 Tax=Elysia crispata TaxID=231223 RepID=A0AAE1CSG0_9GAST|nr:hypothetical protein RRG08_006984 [Elysia crispata]
MSSASGVITYRTAVLSDYDGVMAIGGIYGGRDYLWSLYKQLVIDPDKYGIVAVDGDTVYLDPCMLQPTLVLKSLL